MNDGNAPVSCTRLFGYEGHGEYLVFGSRTVNPNGQIIRVRPIAIGDIGGKWRTDDLMS